MLRYPRQSVVALIVVIAAALAAEFFRRFPADASKQNGSRRPVPGRTTPKGQWTTLESCTLVPDRDNDGDSFSVLHDGETHTFRLYFVDCPEKRRHQYNRDRIADQGRYFGGMSEESVTALGEAARDFVLTQLDGSRFTVRTRWVPVYDSERRYALVELPDGSDLGTRLVERGLARIHTLGTDLPDGRKLRTVQEELRRTEADARRAGRGGWRGSTDSPQNKKPGIKEPGLK